MVDDYYSYIEIDRKEVGARIRALRMAHHMTIEELCERLDVSEQAVGKWQSGLCFPTIPKLYGMAKLFDTSIEAILVGDNER